MVNTLSKMTVCHWSKTGKPVDGNCHPSPGKGRNVILANGEGKCRSDDDQRSKDLFNELVQTFSYEGQWVLDCTRTLGKYLQLMTQFTIIICYLYIEDG